jgi:energy-coupling factor transporter ATP-binding protein EcfA2
VRLQPQVGCATYPDLADVKGQAGARRALEIAAAGGHGLLLVGPPGSGKSMLAQRFAGLLPPMTVDEALESAAVASLAGRFDLARWAVRPTCSPHHSASAVALVGGGSPPRPGEISLAHRGVLFLDELPEFPRAALEALREPLETGHITIARAARRAEFPARFHFVAAMNPCPCGWRGAAHRSCRCAPDQVSRYQARLSGPLLDRIDLHVEVPALGPQELLGAPPGEPSEPVRQRCIAARAPGDRPAGDGQPAPGRRGHRPARAPGCGRDGVPAARGQPAGLERPRHPPRAQGGAHRGRPGRLRRRAGGARRRGGAVPGSGQPAVSSSTLPCSSGHSRVTRSSMPASACRCARCCR